MDFSKISEVLSGNKFTLALSATATGLVAAGAAETYSKGKLNIQTFLILGIAMAIITSSRIVPPKMRIGKNFTITANQMTSFSFIGLLWPLYRRIFKGELLDSRFGGLLLGRAVVLTYQCYKRQ